MASIRTPTLVLASTYRQFRYWIGQGMADRKEGEYIYISEPHQMHGYDRDTPVIFLQLLVEHMPYTTLTLHRRLRYDASVRFETITEEYT